ncbi:hypothetical protein GLAREA_07191 [Glarea lozoyensis ATCC 20868]|uniref:Uncharacterized protein n=1 Tax=Glarea lozoyensis (strain ATCC 20868 / MF5171) TaxID=1116229 RepID=S3E771_GLAL2|nr:uncharacterized protein GLAREA_07191 [Glarea lozoyensis ATCC 20868]EPE34178.1 hypothetical protein GLAREA_07191 [Glarea lozoyensis ATCC 20868]
MSTNFVEEISTTNVTNTTSGSVISKSHVETTTRDQSMAGNQQNEGITRSISRYRRSKVSTEAESLKPASLPTSTRVPKRSSSKPLKDSSKPANTDDAPVRKATHPVRKGASDAPIRTKSEMNATRQSAFQRAMIPEDEEREVVDSSNANQSLTRRASDRGIMAPLQQHKTSEQEHSDKPSQAEGSRKRASSTRRKLNQLTRKIWPTKMPSKRESESTDDITQKSADGNIHASNAADTVQSLEAQRPRRWRDPRERRQLDEDDFVEESQERQIPLYTPHSIHGPNSWEHSRSPPTMTSEPERFAHQEEVFAENGLLGRSYTQRQQRRVPMERMLDRSTSHHTSSSWKGPGTSRSKSLHSSKIPETQTTTPQHRPRPTLSTSVQVLPLVDHATSPTSSTSLSETAFRRQPSVSVRRHSGTPPPLLDFTPVFKEAPQWDVRRKGRGFRPRGEGKLVEFARNRGEGGG